MAKHIMVFGADIHGNMNQFEKLVDYAINVSADSLVLGGDIAPKDLPSDKFISGQRSFLENDLQDIIYMFKKALPDSNVFLMMGNDDCAANLDVLEKHDPDLYTIIHEKRVKLTEDFDLVGYANVPITPFGIKDWEKFDLSHAQSGLGKEYAFRKSITYRFDGYKSKGNKWQRFLFTPDLEKLDSIQKDLEKDLFTQNSKKTIYAFHSPPNNTALDQILGGLYKQHVGSFAVREFIEKNQPQLTLHGHIHETVAVSGQFCDYIGKTLCLTSGNDNYSDKLILLALNIYKSNSVERVELT
ncbi:MAG: metallophosphoesterase [Nanoarchaeota archaeon]|nr:metallophosphoesterase [Nanoarchaeota archaeon]MBU1322148.1 metallophosphoesterase [Nanoarchaeota archaeon]MBU1597869.1 metallophosphoesterase [Nanoarchaeota archaeon]MBU2441288.1 metallophosphoesterase [Nanoarchaeota archaeon]